MKYDYNKDVWYNEDIEYLFDADIQEMDLRDAGFSLIKQFKLLPDEKIQELEGIEKGIKRHIAIGKLQRDDKAFSRALSSRFAEVRHLFIDLNKLNDSDILAVKKDAIFTLKKCEKLKFGLVEFVPKHTYTSYIRFPNIQNIELFYNPGDDIEVKGMSDGVVNRHRIYMLHFIREYIKLMEVKDPSVKRRLISFIADYKSGELDETFYLEFNGFSRDINPIFNLQNVLVPLIEITMKEM